eukprot:gene10394-8338_t
MYIVIGYKLVAFPKRLHRFEVYITRKAEGKTGRVFIGVMTEEKSIKLASTIISEGFIFLVGVSVVSFEYQSYRQRKIEARARLHEEQQALLREARVQREAMAKEHARQLEQITRHME